ncbi:MAG: Fur family transcriptional regulator [Thermodesulfovibrionales bacterium]
MARSAAAIRALRDAGFRMTRARAAIIAELTESAVPLSADDLRRRLGKRGVAADRSTVYREISFLREQSLIHEIPLGDGKLRYKACPSGDHHHIICTGCSRTDAVPTEQGFANYGSRIAKSRGFHLTRRSFELFGLCSACRSKK